MTSGTLETKKKNTPIANFIVGLFVIGLIVGLIAYFGGCGKNEKLELNATISLSGSQFSITNNNDFDWKNVTLQVNPGVISSGFEYKTSTVMQAGHTYTVPASNFHNSDNVMFNPAVYALETFYINCDNDGDGLIDGSGMWSFQ